MKNKNLFVITLTGLIVCSMLTLIVSGCDKSKNSPSRNSETINSDNSLTSSTENIQNSHTLTDASQSSVNSQSSAGSSKSDGYSFNSQSVSQNNPTTTIKNSSSSTNSTVRFVAGKVTSGTMPSDRVKTITNLGYTEANYKAKAAQPASYAGNAGWDVSSIAISPYYTLKVNNTDVQVYASPVYVATGNTGALQSFAMVDVPAGDFYLDISLSAQNISFQNAIVLPQNLGIKTQVTPNRTITARVNNYGIYTFLTTNGSGLANQQHSFVLMVRKLQDEDAEIAAYKAEYGVDNVTVYNAGTHYIDYINITKSNTVIYLRRGSLLVAKHSMDIDSEADNQNKSETGASASNGWGLKRYPFITANGKTNIKIVGRGTMDGGQLDWHERRGILFSSCSNVVLDGINIINFSEWGFISYCSKNVSVRNVMLLGWKTNSDAFALCNTTDSTVEMCFARTGDDMFEVKTLGGPAGAITENVTFTKCYAWGSKARAFGVIGEVEKNINNVIFKECAVLFRDAIWDNNRLGSLVIVAEVGSGNISNITFENIEIYYDYGRAINTTVLRTDSPNNKISGVVFKNITYSANMKALIKTQPTGTNSIDLTFQNVQADGYPITQANYAASVLISGPGGKLTVTD